MDGAMMVYGGVPAAGTTPGRADAYGMQAMGTTPGGVDAMYGGMPAVHTTPSAGYQYDPQLQAATQQAPGANPQAQAAAYQMQQQQQQQQQHQQQYAAPMGQELGTYNPATYLNPQQMDMNVKTQQDAERLGRTAQVTNIPATMTNDSLVMILTGMFGEVTNSCGGVDAVTQRPFSIVEFKDNQTASRALAAQRVQFGMDSLEIIASSFLVENVGGGMSGATSSLAQASTFAAGGSSTRERSRSRDRQLR